jgi:hypothetical protein
MEREYELQHQLVRELSKLGLFVAEVQSTRAYAGSAGASRTTPGFPDLAIIGYGRVHLWELKTPQGRLSAHQKAFHARASERGYHVAVVRSLDEALLFYGQQFVREVKCRRCGAVLR